MAFKGRDPVRTKIVIDNKIMEQVNSFNYLGNTISYEKELNIDNKLHKDKGKAVPLKAWSDPEGSRNLR